MSSILIKNRSNIPLKLNESIDADGNKKYVFTGPFTPCDGVTKNRNGRIYDEKEVLPHLAYLRDKIKSEGMILGELDHPDGRFEISLKEASHKITDLWYDPDKKAVMGKLELLNTDNGKTMKAIVDAGCPLFVSSRAAGTVGNDAHVHIQQIFTYDIVSTPGFEQCELNRVNESMRSQVTNFLNESVSGLKKAKQINVAKNFGVYDPDIQIVESTDKLEITESPSKNVDVKSLCTPIEEDVTVRLTPEKAAELDAQKGQGGAPDAGAGDPNAGGAPEEQHSSDDILTIEPEYKDTGNDAIEDIQPEFNGTEAKSVDDNPNVKPNIQSPGNTGEALVSESFLSKIKRLRKQKTKDILKKRRETDESVKTVVPDTSDGSDEDDYSKGIDISEKDKKKDKTKAVTIPTAKKTIDASANADASIGKSTKAPVKAAKKKLEICPICHQPIFKCKCSKKLKNKKADIDEGTNNLLNKYGSLLNTTEKKNEIRSKIIGKYPFAVSLSETNFNKFSQLLDEDKKECAKFVWDNHIFDIKAINELWNTPLIERKKLQQNYLKLADQSDLNLYNRSSEKVRKGIDEMASFFILNDKDDVDEFWSRTGLREQYQQLIKNEEFVQEYKDAISEDEDETAENPQNMPEGMKFIKFVEDGMKS